MSVSAAQVKDLRERTGAGFMDCKRALAETSGDVDKAIEYLRAKGAAKAEKRGGRAASQGVVIAKVAEQGGYAMLLEVNCETDFVARGDEFSQFAQQVSDLAMTHQCTSTEALLALSYPGDSVSVAEKTQALIATIGENIQVRRLAAYVGEGSISTYTHGDRLASWVVLSEDQGGGWDVIWLCMWRPVSLWQLMKKVLTLLFWIKSVVFTMRKPQRVINLKRFVRKWWPVN